MFWGKGRRGVDKKWSLNFIKQRYKTVWKKIIKWRKKWWKWCLRVGCLNKTRLFYLAHYLEKDIKREDLTGTINGSIHIETNCTLMINYSSMSKTSTTSKPLSIFSLMRFRKECFFAPISVDFTPIVRYPLSYAEQTNLLSRSSPSSTRTNCFILRLLSTPMIR